MKRAAATGEVRVKGSLDRATIVTTALRLLDEVGIDGLSTRRLAAELGIKSASLYWHFKDKNDLQRGDTSNPDFDALEWLADGARAIRRTALSRRDGAQVMARPRTKGAQGKIAFEDNVKTVMRSGLADMEARLTMQTLRRYAIGAALQEQSNKGLAAAVGIVGTGEEGFEYGLQVFLDGLKARLAERAKLAKTMKRARS